VLRLSAAARRDPPDQIVSRAARCATRLRELLATL